MKIDAHHHFWKYDRAAFGWINDAMAVIRRDFLPEDLEREIAAAGIDGVISVQARQSVEETKWLLELADKNKFVRGVVGWVPLASPDVNADLERFAARRKLKGVRHVLHDEADDQYILLADFNDGIRALRSFNLAYDILIFERHLPQTIRFVDQHPDQVFILDHVAKPKIREKALSPWRENIRELAQRPNVYCKLSGMVMEADHSRWTVADLLPYMEIVLEAFGPRRVMAASDWPVCLVACGYRRWFGIIEEFIARFSPTEQDWIMGQTAQQAYRL